MNILPDPHMNELHQIMDTMGIKSCTFKFANDETYEYIFISLTEYQFFKKGECPTNYVMEK